jgi:DNA-directed RNA polymerase specialized sigma24 family protein
MVNEILNTAERSGESGILNTEELRLLIELLDRLYNKVYGKYDEFKEAGMRLQDIIMTRSEEIAEEIAGEIAKEIAEGIAEEIVAKREAKMKAEMEAEMKAEMEAKKAEMEERTREIVRKMKKIGLSVEQIAQVSGFSVKEVEEL